MPKLAALLFALAAVGGGLLALMHFTGKPRPWILTILHGLLAAVGLVLLALPVIEGGAANLKTALVILFVAALGGFFLLSYRLRNRPLPSAVVLVHGAVAAVGFVVLLLAVL